MIAAADLLVLARRTAGLSQVELASRVGRSESAVSRWESGRMEPSYAAVAACLAACGFSARVELFNPDSSYQSHVSDMRALSPLERVRRLAGVQAAERLLALAELAFDGVLIGDVAAALAGWPLRIPTGAPMEVCADRPFDPEGLDVVVDRRPAGTQGLRDLRAHAELVTLDERCSVLAASPIDLLRIERARGHLVQAEGLLAVLEHRRRWPDGPPAPRQWTDAEARQAADAWFNRAA